jgi:HK97 family phage prohead protease
LIRHQDEDYDCERFAFDPFAESIARGGQTFKVDHAATVPGRLTLFEGRELRFRAQLYDSPIGRRVLERTREGAVRGASIGFRARRVQYVGPANVRQVDEADLTELSVCLNAEPAWHSTAVWAE